MKICGFAWWNFGGSGEKRINGGSVKEDERQ